MQTDSKKHDTHTDTNNVLVAAAIWWNRLSPLKRELFEGKYGIIDDNKINDIYKTHTDGQQAYEEEGDFEQVSNDRQH